MAIENARSLQQAREQIARMRRALDDLRQRVEPLNKKNFEILAEGPRDEIQKLEADIAEYLSRPHAS